MAFVVLFLFIFLDLGNVKEENAKKKVMSSHIPLSLNQPSFFVTGVTITLRFKNLLFPHHSAIFVLSQISFPYMHPSISIC